MTILTRACVGENELLVSRLPAILYKVLAQIQNARMELRPFTEDWKLPPGFTDGAKLAVVANPNSPTGTRLEPRELLDVARDAQCLVIADEAYANFAETTCLPLVRDCERLVVTRTLSKSHGLAGIRFGFVVAQPAIIESLIKVKDSYNCDAVSIAAATAAMEDQEYLERTTKMVLATRKRLELSLAELGFQVTPSQANFVWIRRREPVKPIYEALKEQRILIRYLSYPQYGEGLRISVGTDEEINTLLDALRQLV
ncbi:MAG: aminotransferase class I/II-fold pyridoxal phosphate-dependent enzyme [Planctomycetota bacterium]